MPAERAASSRKNRAAGDVFIITLPSGPGAARDVLSALGDFLTAAASCDDMRSTIDIVLAEALNNVIEHAYPDGTGPIYLRAQLSTSRLEVLIRDRGIPLPDHLILPDEAGGPDPADLPEGGFGWHLIRTLADGLGHARLARWNELKVVFNLP